MRFLLATDAWHPQINGVVRTLTHLVAELRRAGHEVLVVSPADFRTLPCPTYPEIRLSLTTPRRLARRIRSFAPDVVHVATEGPIGLSARAAALRLDLPLTTSFHTRFPEYLRRRAPVPERLTYALLRRFHAPAAACLVPTAQVRRELAARGFARLVTWTRGVDRALFRPRSGVDLGLKAPVFLCVGRVAPEKGLEAFLDLDLPGSKLVVGGGPALAALKARYPDVRFVGSKVGEELVDLYNAADVFVFPSRTDTFGIVLLEALACGVPVAAFPEPGPIEVLAETGAGVLDEDLRAACLKALTLDPADALGRSEAFTWAACAERFVEVAALALANHPVATAQPSVARRISARLFTRPKHQPPGM